MRFISYFYYLSDLSFIVIVYFNIDHLIMDDKFRKSLVKYFQNEEKLSKFLSYIPLI